MARYSRLPPRVAALRRTSREIVLGERPSLRAIARIAVPLASSIAISSRSLKDRNLAVGPDTEGARWVGGIPPELRNQRGPSGVEMPASAAASSLVRPRAIACQKRQQCSRCQAGGLPGERNFRRVLRSDARRPTIVTISNLLVLRRPVESALHPPLTSPAVPPPVSPLRGSLRRIAARPSAPWRRRRRKPDRPSSSDRRRPWGRRPWSWPQPWR